MIKEKSDTLLLPTLHGESKTAILDEILQQKLEKALHKPTQAVTVHDIAKIASEHSAVDLAIAASHLPIYARTVLFENLLSTHEKMQFLIDTDSYTRVAILREIALEEVVKVIELTPPDEAVEVLEDLSERRYRKVMEMLDADKAVRIREIAKNARNTAGRLMTNEFFAFSMEVTIGAAASTIRNNPGIDVTRRIFVVNQEGELQGHVPARTLIVNPPDLPLKQVMLPILQKVTADFSREEVVELVERYQINALPVVNERGRLIGVITSEDVLDAMGDILDETIASVAGTTEKVGENESALKKFLARSPWLIVTLCAGLINVGVMSSFNHHAKGMLTFVLFFVPLITGMSGNIGIQSSTVLVRSMALGFMRPGTRREVIFKELLGGVYAAFFFGILCGVLIHLMDFIGMAGIEASPWAIGLIVSIGLFGACLAGTLLGALSPLFFARVGIDPAVASGPIVTAFNDFFSMTIYFLIAIGVSSLVF